MVVPKFLTPKMYSINFRDRKAKFIFTENCLTCFVKFKKMFYKNWIHPLTPGAH